MGVITKKALRKQVEWINQLKKEILEEINITNKPKSKKLQQKQQDLIKVRQRIYSFD